MAGRFFSTLKTKHGKKQSLRQLRNLFFSSMAATSDSSLAFAWPLLGGRGFAGQPNSWNTAACVLILPWRLVLLHVLKHPPMDLLVVQSSQCLLNILDLVNMGQPSQTQWRTVNVALTVIIPLRYLVRASDAALPEQLARASCSKRHQAPFPCWGTP